MFFWREMFAPNGQLSEDALSKVCFGTDMSYFAKDGLVNPDIQQYIRFYERLFEEVGAPKALREKVNAENILALFNHRIKQTARSRLKSPKKRPRARKT